MNLRIPAGAVGAIAGIAMLAGSSGSAAAFTLSSPSLSQPVLSPGVERVWWDRWGRWHPNWGWRRRWRHPDYRAYYYGAPYPYYWGRPRPWRHCWWTFWGPQCGWY